MRSKGMPEGKSELGGQTVYVKDKQARLKDGTLAGSVLMYKDAFKNAMSFMDASLFDAVEMSSVNQAREFNLTSKGTLEVGKMPISTFWIAITIWLQPTAMALNTTPKTEPRFGGDHSWMHQFIFKFITRFGQILKQANGALATEFF